MLSTSIADKSASAIMDQGHAPLRVVIVDEELPFPLTSGKRIRTFNLVSRLAGRHHLSYVCHRNPNAREQSQAEEVFRDLGISTVIVDRTVPKKSGLGFYFRLGLNLFSSLPYSVSSHNTRAMRQAIQQFETENPVDLWHCEWTPYAEPMQCVRAPLMIMTHNVESMIWQRYHEMATNPLKKWYIAKQWNKFAAFEKRVLLNATGSVAVSQADADHFANEMGARSVEVVDNGVDTVFFQPDATARERKTILFLGSLDWRPNLDGLDQLLSTVFPKVLRAHPDARLDVVGRNPPEWLQRTIQESDNVWLHANVPDVRPFLHRSSLLAVPLRIGGGSRLKILEALATGLPVVSTAVGAEGLHLKDGEHLRIAELGTDFDRALIESLENPESAQRQGQMGRNRVVDRYDWSSLAQKLESIWLKLALAKGGQK